MAGHVGPARGGTRMTELLFVLLAWLGLAGIVWAFVRGGTR